MIIYRHTAYNLISYYWFTYLQDPLHDTNDFMFILISSFVSDITVLPPHPMKNIHNSSVFHVNDSSMI